jgi:tetratricopeptide (TPR) repeat protein
MRFNGKRLTALIVLAVFPLSGCSIVHNLQARNSLNRGVKAFKDQKYSDAAQCFEESLKLQPDFENARIFLAMSYSSQFIPGSKDSKNLELANKAIQNFEEVIGKAKNPDKPNKNSMISLAKLYSQMKQIDKSKEECKRILKFYPNTAEAWHRIAVMDFDEAAEITGVDGKNIADIKPEDRAKVLLNVEDGLTALGNALQIRPDYFEAMDCQSRLLRLKAKFEKDPQARIKLIQLADELRVKSIKKAG